MWLIEKECHISKEEGFNISDLTLPIRALSTVVSFPMSSGMWFSSDSGSGSIEMLFVSPLKEIWVWINQQTLCFSYLVNIWYSWALKELKCAADMMLKFGIYFRFQHPEFYGFFQRYNLFIAQLYFCFYFYRLYVCFKDHKHYLDKQNVQES